MAKFIESHLYLTSQIVIFSFYCIGFIVFFRSKKQILISSLFALPQAYFSLALIPIYWNPDLTPFLGIGLEDFTFCFLSGGLVWVSVLVFYNDRMIYALNTKKIQVRCFICIVFGVASFLFLYFLNIRTMVNPFIIMVLWSILVLVFNPGFWKIAFVGSFTFSVIYTLGMKIGFIIWPQLISFWTLKNLSGILFLQIPVEELVWAFLYGCSWSLAMAYILDVQLKPYHTSMNYGRANV
jgi:hypothetical protein